MKGIKKYLAAACVLALSVVLLAGCSSQASSSAASSSGSASASSAASSAASASASASSAASQASQEDLIKEIEAAEKASKGKSATINIDGAITIDVDAMVGALSESSDSSASAASESSGSASASSSSVMEVPINMVIKADESQEAFKMAMSMNMMGIPFDLYIDGDKVVIVMADQAFGGSLQDLEALGMSQYSSLEGALNSGGAAAEFNQYKDAIKNVTKETVSDETVYTVELDASKIDSGQIASSLAQSGATGDVTTMIVTYVVGADGKLASTTLDMGATGFSMVTTAKLSDVDKTVVPDAPEATMSFSDLANYMTSSGTAASSSSAAAAA